MAPKKNWPVFILLAILALVLLIGVSANKNETAGPAANASTPVETSESLPIDQEQPEEEQPNEEAVPVDRQTEPSPPDSNLPQPEAPSQEFIPPQNGYWLEVSVSEQKVRVYQDGTLIKEWPASTGTADKPTPLGVFATQNRGEWFYSPKYKQGAKWWVSFRDWGVYLFHTVPMDQEQNIITEEADKLGTPASHGCVRLEVENSKWIYDNIPQGVPVYIHD